MLGLSINIFFFYKSKLKVNFISKILEKLVFFSIYRYKNKNNGVWEIKTLQNYLSIHKKLEYI